MGEYNLGSNNTNIYIITGAIDSGKTTALISIYNSLSSGDGFALTKIYNENNYYIGQNIKRLSTGASRYFSFKKAYIPSIWDESTRYKDYSFSKKGLLFASEIILDILTHDIEPIFLDEIGPLELLGSGFYDIFTKILLTNSKLYFTTRKDCLAEVINFFKLKNYSIINID